MRKLLVLITSCFFLANFGFSNEFNINYCERINNKFFHQSSFEGTWKIDAVPKETSRGDLWWREITISRDYSQAKKLNHLKTNNVIFVGKIKGVGYNWNGVVRIDDPCLIEKRGDKFLLVYKTELVDRTYHSTQYLRLTNTGIEIGGKRENKKYFSYHKK